MSYKYYNHNGHILTDSSNSKDGNRGFLFGDGFFESMRMEDGRILLRDLHEQRVLKSLGVLNLDQSGIPSIQNIEKMAIDLAERNDLRKLVRIRWSIYRDGGGLYTPETTKVGFTLNVSELDHKITFSESGVSAGIYNDQKKVFGELSPIKSLSAQLYINAAMYAVKNGWDESIMINHHDEIMEGHSSNIFILKDGIWMTPAIQSGCINGVMRKSILEQMRASNILVNEVAFKTEELLDADEIFFSNAIKGIYPVRQLQGKKFGYQQTKEIFRLVFEKD